MDEGFRDMREEQEKEKEDDSRIPPSNYLQVPGASAGTTDSINSSSTVPDIIRSLSNTESKQRSRAASVILDAPKEFIRMLSRGSTGSGEQQKMKWGSIWLAAVILFLVAVQFSLYFASLWPYMSQIDKTATQTFYGFTLAAYSAGQMVASPIFGYWNNRAKQARIVIAAGVCCSMGGNLVYMFAEASELNRKWIIMAARFICGLGGGIAGTIRGYLATASTVEHRARAIAIGTAALSLGITAGPAIQAALTPIGYPGFVVGPIHLSQYTAPSYVSVFVGLILQTFLFTMFKENYVGIDERAQKNPYHYVPKYDLRGALLCILCWFAMFFSITNSETVESPYTMAIFKWNNSKAVFYNSIILTVSSLMSFLVYTGYAIYGKRINERVSVICGLCMLFGFYAITFPWSFYTGKLEYKHGNASERTYDANTSTTGYTNATGLDAGCDIEMEWCEYTPRLPMPVYLCAFPFLSIGLPSCNVAISTLFSKILGPRRQGFMQSLMIMCGSAARLLGPIMISWLFANFGPRVAWTMTATVMAITIFAFLTQFHRLVPLKMRPKLRYGQKLKYDGGTLYRF